MNIAFTGGWTWGHITPIASLIEYGLQDTEITRDCKLFRFGEANSMESKTANKFPEVTFVSIPAGKLRRYRTFRSTRQNIKDARKGIVGIVVAMKMLKKRNIEKLFCKWWYVALPVSIAAYVLRIPIILHESDTHAGMTNRLVARMAHTVFSGFPNSLPKEHVIRQLLSPRFLDPNSAFYPTHDQQTVVLVTGWSQWATTLFEALLSFLSTNTQHQFHFLIVLGTKNEHYKQQFDQRDNCTSFTFIDDLRDMARLNQISDISITRWWATSLAEQHVYGIRKIIVPVPRTWGNHQQHNGVRYRDTYGDILIEQNDTLTPQLASTLQQFIGYKKTTQQPDTISVFTPLQTVRQSLTE